MDKSNQPRAYAVSTTRNKGWESEYLLLLFAGAVILCVLAVLAQQGVDASGHSLTGQTSIQQLHTDTPQAMSQLVAQSEFSDDATVDIESDSSIDWLLIELPTPHSQPFDFRLVDSMAQADETVYSVAVPRSIKMAIP